MGAWDGTKLGLKVRPDDYGLAEQLLRCLGVNLESGICEEVGVLSDSYKPNIEGEVESGLLGIISLLDEHVSEYVDQFYSEYEEEYDEDEYDEDEDSEDDNDADFDFSLDDLFHLINRLFAPAYVYLAHELGNNTSDDYYRYEAILDPLTGKKTELNCFYSYGDGINLDGDNPKIDATESNEECIVVRNLDEKVIDWLIDKAEENKYDGLAQRLKNCKNNSNSGGNVFGAEELKKQILSQMQTHYLKLKEKYLNLIQTIPFHIGSRDYYSAIICWSDNYWDKDNLLAKRFVSKWGDNEWDSRASTFDFLIVDDQICDPDFLNVKEAEEKTDWIQWALNILPKKIREAQEQQAFILKKTDFVNDIEKEKASGYPSLQKRISFWKASIPFDHVSTISFEGKNIVTADLSGKWLYDYLHIDRNVLWDQWPTRDWIVEKGGDVKPNVTLACDYLIVGLDATIETPKVVQAIRYRDSGKSQIKLIPEDELLRMLNGEVLEISAEDQQSMQARQDMLRKEEEARQQAAMEKKRLAEEERRRKIEQQQAARAELAEQKRQERIAAQQQKAAEQAAEQVAKAEKRRLQEEERAKTLFDNVVYSPGEEPENIRKRINNLFAKLNEAYPDKQISRLQADHKKWDETASELRKILGYPDKRAFLEAYGYTVVQDLGGRPSHDFNAVIEELKRRYPNGGGKNASNLQKDNPDLPIKTLINNAQKLFGMSLKEYLTQIGVL